LEDLIKKHQKVKKLEISPNQLVLLVEDNQLHLLEIYLAFLLILLDQDYQVLVDYFRVRKRKKQNN
jgi:hypothetical protein